MTGFGGTSDRIWHLRPAAPICLLRHGDRSLSREFIRYILNWISHRDSLNYRPAMLFIQSPIANRAWTISALVRFRPPIQWVGGVAHLLSDRQARTKMSNR